MPYRRLLSAANRPPEPRLVLDIALALLIALLTTAASLALGTRIAPILYQEVDLYFGADINRVYDYMTGGERFAQFRSTVHPVFTFLFFPPTRSFMGLGAAPEQAAQIIVALGAGTTAAILYAIGRLTGLHRADAALLCALFLGSAGFIFWWTVPETFSFGGMSVALAFMVTLLPAASLLVWVLTGALALSITTTNWAAPLLGSLLRLDRRQVIRAAAIAFGIVIVLSVWQRAYLPTARFFFLPGAFAEELVFVPLVSETAWPVGLVERLGSFWLAPWMVPRTILTETEGIRPVNFSYPVLGWLALAGIAAVLVSAAEALRRRPDLRPLALVPALFLGFQFALHMVYGDEPFLYAAHFMPALLCLAAFGFLGRLAWLCRIGAGGFVLLGGAGNLTTFLAVQESLRTLPLP
ncbi:hypothetical protein [Pseudogemmobacter sonorensis]|uniref:hypothetical protein n=1 Tax=Pseudogemmobacter sonorensis TaxID=2989681 RepID=UPI0036A6B880